MGAQIISFKCIVKNHLGRMISSTFNRDVITAINDPNAKLDGLSRGLQQLKKGEKRKISLAASEAYGLYEPQKVILYPKKKLPKQVRVGETISITSKTGAVRSYLVSQIHDDLVSLDGNHPLAGQDLVFEIEAIDVREATDQEIADSSNVVSSQVLH